MPERDLVELFVEPLNRGGFRYLISGSVAAMLYGEPRLTHDVDLLLFLPDGRAQQFAELFPEREFYVPPVEVILTQVARERGHFNLVHSASGLKADVYPARTDEFHQWAFRNRRSYEIDGHMISVAPPEYVIVRKLEYFREGGSEKHLRDVRAMLDVSPDAIDQATLNEWIQRQGVTEQWRAVST